MENLDKEVWQGRETKDRLYLKESGAAIAGDRQVQIWLWEPVGSHVQADGAHAGECAGL